MTEDRDSRWSVWIGLAVFVSCIIAGGIVLGGVLWGISELVVWATASL